jgi:hypothetical protein
MTAIIPKSKKAGSWLACIAAIAMVIAGVLYLHTPYLHNYSNVQIPLFGPFNSTTVLFFLRTVYDDSFTQAVSNISNFVPRNETLIVTTRSAVPVIKYFTGHPTTRIPSNVTSYESLVQYMSKNDFSYLVIPKISRSQVESKIELKNDFIKIGDFKTKYSKIFLYKKIEGS